MSDERRFGGLPLVVYLTALIAIPLTGLVIFGAREVERNATAADNARIVAETISQQTTAVEVIPPLQIERIVALGSTRVTELGLGADDIDPAVAAGLSLVLAGNADRLDERLDQFADVLDETESMELATGLDAAIAEIDSLRTDLGPAGAEVEEVTNVYESVLAIVAEFLEETTEVFRTNPAAFDAERLILEHTLGGLVLRTANDEVSQIADVFVGTENFDLITLVAAEARHLDALDRTLEVTDNPVPIVDLVADRSELTPFLATWSEEGPITWEAVALEPSLYDDYLALVLERLIYLGEVEQFVAEVGDDIIGFAEEVADGADRDTQRTLLALIAIGVAVLAFEILLVRTFARPLRRLRDQATRIGDGDLTVEALPIEGPSDVREVTGAVNEMASTLDSVDDHLTRLALGDSSDTALADSIPGSVGASIRESVQRLTALTTELQMSEERLQDEARHDGLTMLFNRFGVIEHLDVLVAGRPSALAVYIVDLDGFKNVNDTNGQAVGDSILLEIAQRLNVLTGDDGVVARIGGDEFLIVNEAATDEPTALGFGERVIETIERPHAVGDDLLIVLPASVGVSLVEPGATALEAVEHADAAVYHAKRRGRGRVEMYDAELQTAIEHDAEIELALRQGISDGELQLFLQPSIDLRTGEVAGAEALVRWERPGSGLVSPGEFVPVAERSGLIIQIDRWVLDAACQRIADWQRRDPGCALRLAVNVSGRHLTEGDLVADLDAAIAATGADPRLLELELTESQLLDDVGRIVTVLDEVRARGVAVSIDDFGTGYSSMTYLQRLPLDAVKVDRSFVANAPDRPFDAMVIESIVRLATALSLAVVAEGVETTEQLQLARAKGVDRVQGYLLARPMPISEAEDYIFGTRPIDLARLDTDQAP